jgi:hypothetical protein
MLAELAAANAAYAVIKETLSNGGDLISVGGKLAEYVGLKQKIAAKSKENGGICDEFWALEKLRQQEEELKTLLIYQGRPGLWDDWLRFQENKRKEEAEQARQEKKKFADRREMAKTIGLSLLIVLLCFSLVGVIALSILVARQM